MLINHFESANNDKNMTCYITWGYFFSIKFLNWTGMQIKGNENTKGFLCKKCKFEFSANSKIWRFLQYPKALSLIWITRSGMQIYSNAQFENAKKPIKSKFELLSNSTLRSCLQKPKARWPIFTTFEGTFIYSIDVLKKLLDQ